MSQYSDFFGVASSGGGATVPINARVEFFIADGNTPGFDTSTGIYEVNGETYLETVDTLPADIYGSTYPLATVTPGQMSSTLNNNLSPRSRSTGTAYHATRDQILTAQALGGKTGYRMNFQTTPVPYAWADSGQNWAGTPTTQPGVPQNILINLYTMTGHNPEDDHSYITMQNTQNSPIMFEYDENFSRVGYLWPNPHGTQAKMTGVGPAKLLVGGGNGISYDGTYVHMRGGNTFYQYSMPTFTLDGTITLPTPEPATGLYTWTPLSLTKAGGPYSGGTGNSMAYDSLRSTYVSIPSQSQQKSWTVSTEAFLGDGYPNNQTLYPNGNYSKVFVRIG